MNNKIKTEAELRQEDLERINRLRLLDDDFLVTFFTDNIEDTETLLRTILDKKDLKVKTVQTQRPIRNLVRRSLALDIYAEDEDGALEEGVKKMSSVIDEIKTEMERQTKARSVFRWLAMGVSVEDIAKGEDLPVEEVKEIIEQNSALMAGQR